MRTVVFEADGRNAVNSLLSTSVMAPRCFDSLHTYPVATTRFARLSDIFASVPINDASVIDIFWAVISIGTRFPFASNGEKSGLFDCTNCLLIESITSEIWASNHRN